MPGVKPGVRCCPSSLYTFPVGLRPGLARDRHVRGFPEFGQFCIARFRASTQVFLKSAASAIPPRPLSDDGYFKLAEHTGGGAPLQKWGRGAPSRAGEGIDRDAGIGPPFLVSAFVAGRGGPRPCFDGGGGPFLEKPSRPGPFSSPGLPLSASPPSF